MIKSESVMYYTQSESEKRMPEIELEQWLTWANGSYFTDSHNPLRSLLLPRVPKGIFLAHPFTSELTADGNISPSTRYRVESLLDGFRASDFLVHCSLEREVWGEKTMSPEILARVDYREIEKSDMLVAFPQTSQGVCIEIGWAGALGKDICICWDIGKDTTIDLRGILERLYSFGGIIPEIVLYEGGKPVQMVGRVAARVKEILIKS